MEPGTVIAEGKRIEVATGDGTLFVTELQVPEAEDDSSGFLEKQLSVKA